MGSGIFAGFTSRFGGVSGPPWESLNLGHNVSDNPAHVAANRRIVAELFGAPVAFASQVHGNRVLFLSDDEAAPWRRLFDAPVTAGEADGMGTAGSATWSLHFAAAGGTGADGNSHPPQYPITAGEADGMVTDLPELGLGVLVADCVPILIASEFGVGVAHAGRRGIELGVIARAVEQLSALGASPIKAAIGPAICGKCYEVPAQMQAEVCAIAPAAFATTAKGTPSLDLPAAAAAQLEAAGAAVVYRSLYCTFEHEEYFSHRRATLHNSQTGRQAGLILRRPGG
ncbi:MAG: polyphenol oxidase family protein [Cellulomonadaceae bacterium]|jgi:YfiH family protein|nr:polyphenol oxidase family protein [Cellulomonadaceae bacterium]